MENYSLDSELTDLRLFVVSFRSQAQWILPLALVFSNFAFDRCPLSFAGFDFFFASISSAVFVDIGVFSSVCNLGSVDFFRILLCRFGRCQ